MGRGWRASGRCCLQLRNECPPVNPTGSRLAEGVKGHRPFIHLRRLRQSGCCSRTGAGVCGLRRRRVDGRGAFEQNTEETVMASRYPTSASFLSIGQVCGKWTILEVGRLLSLCRCECGEEKLIRNNRLATGKITGGCHSCANSRPRPGRRKFDSSLPKEVYRRLSALVDNAISRCTDREHAHWEYYGGRGITIQDTWLENPSLFVEYLATLDGFDNPALVIDRIENNKGYVVGNLRFVTRSVSQRNKGPYKRRIYVD